MTYGSRTPSARPPSGGTGLSKPIAGSGKLPWGRHRVEVLSVVRVTAGHWCVILATPAGHCHAEDVEDWPPELVAGTTCTVVVSPTPDGFVLARDGGRFQAQRAGTFVPLTDWFPSPQAVYEAASALGVAPSSTELTEVAYEGVQFRPRVRRAQTRGAAVAADPSAVSPAE